MAGPMLQVCMSDEELAVAASAPHGNEFEKEMKNDGAAMYLQDQLHLTAQQKQQWASMRQHMRARVTAVWQRMQSITSDLSQVAAY